MKDLSLLCLHYTILKISREKKMLANVCMFHMWYTELKKRIFNIMGLVIYHFIVCILGNSPIPIVNTMCLFKEIICTRLNIMGIYAMGWIIGQILGICRCSSKNHRNNRLHGNNFTLRILLIIGIIHIITAATAQVSPCLIKYTTRLISSLKSVIFNFNTISNNGV